MRILRELREFSQYLLEIGEGRHDHGALDEDYIKIPREMVIDDRPGDGGDELPVPLGLKRIVDLMYNEEDLNNPSIATVATRTILTPTNAAVQSVNDAVAKRLNGPTQVYLSTDSIDDDAGDGSAFYETEFLDELMPNGMPPHKLFLKKGAPIMMLRNLNPADGLCNGTRLRVVELKDHVIRATIMTGSHHGKEVLIPRIIFISGDDIKDFRFVCAACSSQWCRLCDDYQQGTRTNRPEHVTLFADTAFLTRPALRGTVKSDRRGQVQDADRGSRERRRRNSVHEQHCVSRKLRVKKSQSHNMIHVYCSCIDMDLNYCERATH